MIPVTEWIGAAEAARGEGFSRFVLLTAVDEWGRVDELSVVLRLANESAEQRELTTALPRIGGLLPSLTGIFPAACYAECEIAAAFGIAIVGVGEVGSMSNLRKDILLEARAAQPWPGARCDEGRARRRQLAVGVPDPTAETEEERVATAWGGGRRR